MIIQNVSKMLIVLADSVKHYGTLKPGQKTYLDDSCLEVDCISTPIAEGMVKVVEKGGKADPQVTVAVPARAAKVEDFISKFSKREHEDDESNAGTVTAGKPEDGSDYTPPSKPPKKGKPSTQDLGQKLVKGKTVKKKLIPMVKTTPESKQEVVKSPPVIKISGDGGDVALDNGSLDGTLIINESGIPGQARTVSIHDANAEDLDRAAKLTDQVLDQAAQSRKLAIYMALDQEGRERFVENTTDVEFLKEVATIEWQGGIAKSVRDKIGKLGAKNE